MYSRVPPQPQPSGHLMEGAHETSDSGKAEEAISSSSKPANVSQEQWERFQKLKHRREELCGKGRTRRVNALRKKALDQVSRDLTELDKRVLIEEGATLPVTKTRKRHRETRSDVASSVGRPPLVSSGVTQEDVGASVQCLPSVSSSSKWQEMRKYLDPNPQLRGQASFAQKSGLERVLDEAVVKGEFEKAAVISDNMATRDLASKIATAFDCVEYTKRQKLEKERKKKKPAKLKWSFDQKNRWEMKGNM